MSLDKETQDFIKTTIEESQKNLMLQLNKWNTHLCNRFDGIQNRLEIIESRIESIKKRTETIESRLESIESRIIGVAKDTDILPDIFEILEGDGKDIAKLNIRVDEINQPKN